MNIQAGFSAMLSQSSRTIVRSVVFAPQRGLRFGSQVDDVVKRIHAQGIDKAIKTDQFDERMKLLFLCSQEVADYGVGARLTVASFLGHLYEHGKQTIRKMTRELEPPLDREQQKLLRNALQELGRLGYVTQKRGAFGLSPLGMAFLRRNHPGMNLQDKPGYTYLGNGIMIVQVP